jgi:hypothetical protein
VAGAMRGRRFSCGKNPENRPAFACNLLLHMQQKVGDPVQGFKAGRKSENDVGPRGIVSSVCGIRDTSPSGTVAGRTPISPTEQLVMPAGESPSARFPHLELPLAHGALGWRRVSEVASLRASRQEGIGEALNCDSARRLVHTLLLLMEFREEMLQESRRLAIESRRCLRLPSDVK